jgi:type IX secretion system PorP/SprF family membrane protein
MNMRRILIFAFFSVLAISVQAQNDPQYSQYIFNKLVLNPAYAGSTGDLSIRLMSRWQWVGFQNAPKTQTVSMHMPTANLRHGVGINFVMDRLGHSRSLLFNVNYAYRIPIGSGHLGIGLNMGLKQFSLLMSNVEDPTNDPIFQNQDQHVIYFVAGPGLYYQNEFFYAGASMPNLMPGNLDYIYAVPGSVSKAPKNLYLMGGAAIALGEAVKLRPSVMVRATPRLPMGLDLGVGVMFKDRILVGTIWRPGNSLVMQLQGYITPKLQIGYSYDLTLKEIRGYSSGSHEVMLGIDLNVHQSTTDSPIRF